MNNKLIVALLKTEVLPTMGCTEPGAVALAAAYASNAIDGVITKIDITVNPNIYKNGVAVGIPGTEETGLYFAAALGAIKKHPEKQLAVLEGVTVQEIQLARAMLDKNIVDVNIDNTKTGLWIRVKVFTPSDWCEVIIKDKHTNVVSIERNGEYILNHERQNAQETVDNRLVLRDDDITIASIVETVEHLPIQDIEFLLDGVDMNVFAAEQGIEKSLGMGIGAMYDKLIADGILSDDIINYAKKLTAAAADARMSGENVRIMSSAGSGNHGITVILPVYAVAKKVNASRERFIRAIALSHIITVYVKIRTGNLSALCGCAVAAATGAAAAISLLMGGDVKTIEAAMKNVIANLTGMICDGGKVGCSLKLSTAAAAAVESSLLAQRNIVVPDTNGIIAPTIESTIKNLGIVSNPGMLTTDKVILDVMLQK